MIELRLPYPPSANRLWTRTRHGMRKSDVYERWLNIAGWEARAQRPAKVLGPYKLIIHAARPDKRARDIDNLIKPVSDLLQLVGVVKNDSDCEMVSARWVTSGEGVIVIVGNAAMEDA